MMSNDLKLALIAAGLYGAVAVVLIVVVGL